jgi:hypothetical protein
MNFNEISVSSSLITKKQKIHHNEHDLQQSKLKNLVINELKTFFVSRNQNHRQSNGEASSETNVQLETPILVQQCPTQSLNRVILTKTNENSKQLLSIRASTTLLTSFSLLTNILLTRGLIRSSQKFSNVFNLLSDTLLYSTSTIFGCLSTQCIKQTKFFYMKNLLLHACLILFAGEKIFSSRQSTFSERFSIRMLTSILHLVAGFMIPCTDKNNI